MKKYVSILILALVALAMIFSIGCRPVKEVEKLVYKTKDSVITKDSIVVKERIAYSPVDSAAIKALVNCPDVKPIEVKGKTAIARFEIKNGVAKVDCFCDSAAIRIKEKEHWNRVFKERLNSTESVSKSTVEVPYYPLWLKILAAVGVASAIYWTFKLIIAIKS